MGKRYKIFLLEYNHLFTYEHSVRVANEARKIAKRFQLNEEQAAIAGYLHDISAIYPNNDDFPSLHPRLGSKR